MRLLWGSLPHKVFPKKSRPCFPEPRKGPSLHQPVSPAPCSRLAEEPPDALLSLSEDEIRHACVITAMP